MFKDKRNLKNSIKWFRDESECKTWRKAHAFHKEYKPVSRGPAIHSVQGNELKIELTSLKEAVKGTQSLNLLLLNWV